MVTPVPAPAPVGGASAPPNFVLSLIRTWVPVIIGSLISWLANLGIEVSAQYQGILIVIMTAAIIGLYYTAVRFLETRFPAIGVLLGAAQPPVYTLQTPTVASTAPTSVGVQPVYPPESNPPAV